MHTVSADSIFEKQCSRSIENVLFYMIFGTNYKMNK